MNKVFLTFLCFTVGMFSCSENKEVVKEPYLRWVGDIQFDEEIDDPHFKLCYTDDEVRQYFNFSKGVQYRGEKPAIIQYFKENYQNVDSDQSGLLRIRFIVNCHGDTGRFRLKGMNAEYQEMEFDAKISDQILELTKKMEGWLPIEMEEMDNMTLDYYQYLIFKIDRGEIIEIMP
ncbi:hypothetical protein MATR_10460 [Marivirga tractuosa]|uniref:Lipoprotein n=1 Tax=Marivirga tractuosa (strain ATCC 23168 / DSM 4126 / NBRC 15989 / NCIMB 1408 / VKM B-1430 / H-43) TaxID=643867 RepID=E4TM49_MARTH|nr:hypothetical protein [Marivirga tractuosa]ADR21325.1 hypothetical protein Ftrac_1335 [Marivirga tractuosa DSM 4126]BDD14221.1 hypothetical protein MATR_10460 [Marivirga tractuosa]